MYFHFPYNYNLLLRYSRIVKLLDPCSESFVLFEQAKLESLLEIHQFSRFFLSTPPVLWFYVQTTCDLTV